MFSIELPITPTTLKKNENSTIRSTNADTKIDAISYNINVKDVFLLSEAFAFSSLFKVSPTPELFYFPISEIQLKKNSADNIIFLDATNK